MCRNQGITGRVPSLVVDAVQHACKLGAVLGQHTLQEDEGSESESVQQKLVAKLAVKLAVKLVLCSASTPCKKEKSLAAKLGL